jgi:hypothetical protein
MWNNLNNNFDANFVIDKNCVIFIMNFLMNLFLIIQWFFLDITINYKNFDRVTFDLIVCIYSGQEKDVRLFTWQLLTCCNSLTKNKFEIKFFFVYRNKVGKKVNWKCKWLFFFNLLTSLYYVMKFVIWIKLNWSKIF